MAVADDTFPQQVQLSLVFPRNETYDISSGVLPVIFAITNTHYANPLRPFIGVHIYNDTDTDPKPPSYELGFLDLVDLEKPTGAPIGITYSGDNTTYLHWPALNVTGLEGTWLLRYSVDVTGVVPSRTYITPNESHILTSVGSIVFTTSRNGNGAAGVALSLDADGLARGTTNTSCAAVPFSQSVTVTDVVQNQNCEGRTPYIMGDPNPLPIAQCPVLANDTQIVVADYGRVPNFVNMTTAGLRCAPTVDMAAASAIASKMANAMICFGPNPNTSVQATSCPPRPLGSNVSNIASLLTAGSISVPGLAALMVVVVGIATGVLSL
ncbi:hypothetical protein Sste5344_000340 [Sporothrix stenoceras]